MKILRRKLFLQQSGIDCSGDCLFLQLTYAGEGEDTSCLIDIKDS